MRKVIISLSIIGVVAAIVIGGTIAYFSDTETSVGNTFAAGAIDLKIDNESYVTNEEGVLVRSEATSWDLSDLDGRLFFNFSDLKPGDIGEDTVSLHVNDNDAWACVTIDLTKNDDVSCTEPELHDDPNCYETNQDDFDGDLAQELQFIFWVDDGDNVLEIGEEQNILMGGPAIDVLDGKTYTIADSEYSITEGPLVGGETYYIGKAWCFGDLDIAPVPSGENTPLEHPGIICSGSSVTNASQTDSVMGDITFYVEQARNNSGFICGEPQGPERTTLGLENKDIDGTWDPILQDGTYGTLTFISSHPTFNYTLDVYGLVPNTGYSIIYYADPWPGNNPGALIGTLTTDGNGDASTSGDKELGTDIPNLSDANYPTGGKIWVIKTSEYTPNSVNIWPVGEESLFENNLIIYNDTNN